MLWVYGLYNLLIAATAFYLGNLPGVLFWLWLAWALGFFFGLRRLLRGIETRERSILIAALAVPLLTIVLNQWQSYSNSRMAPLWLEETKPTPQQLEEYFKSHYDYLFGDKYD